MDKPNKVFLVLGRYGEGKSTFINTLCNFFDGGPCDTELKVAIPNEHLVQNRMIEVKPSEVALPLGERGRTTKQCALYQFRVPLGECDFAFVDTPGLGSSHMTEEEVKMEIRKCLTSTYASNIHGVIVVINPTLVGQDSQKDMLCAKFAKENLPSFIANNTFVVFSNALDSNVGVADIGFPSSQSVCMNNKFFSNPAGSYDTNAMVSAFEIIGAQILWPTLAEMTIPGHLSQQ
ncbi:hypothetical protein DFA_05774 [Cavenderia fasciculata]|uniref:G domain-containing protein n=1 Tax=Cavenderia fasciculata TaxID=261658 RepID=F4PMJ3_CACFS|nr:uncharacterized protein DFA_05774 [Cavenderia fasciculata]EGG23640.1 hypothetical protein DFA_05774 [Cavenderia fasciculata]|eukprot:XP_004361491.1 hypothetical protein DFA_05774 [Cavenderia fasciculata]